MPPTGEAPGGARVLHYRLERKLGGDALGDVFLSLDEALDRDVVLKVVQASAAAAPGEVAGWRAYFRSEARRAARVSHPGLVTIHAYEEVGDADVIVMEHAAGETIEAMLERGVRWWPAAAVRLVVRAAEAVEAAHAQAVAHGQLSLRNVKLTDEGRLKVLDLGIPKLARGAELPLAQAAGQGPRGRPQADVEALGEMLYRLLTEGRRFGGSPALADSHADSLDQAVDAWILGPVEPVLDRALAPKSGERYATAGELAAALTQVLDAAMQSAAAPYRLGAWGYARTDRLPGMRGGSGQPESPGEPPEPPESLPYRPPSNIPPSPSRLVLPPDFDPSMMPEEFPLALTARPRLPARALAAARRLEVGGKRRLLLVAGVTLLLAAGAAAAWVIAGGGGASEEEPAAMDGAALDAAPTMAAPPTEVAAADSTDALEPAPAELEGRVTSPVAGATAQVVGGDAEAVPLPADLAVPVGDSVVLRIARPGYVPATRIFRGGTLDVPLVPDSVTVAVRTNVPAAVLLAPPSGELRARRIGASNTVLRVPTGRYRLVVRSPWHDDWVTAVTWTTPGARHSVEKTDFATRGSLLVTVDGTWARVSLDGGEAHETPYRFEDVPVGPHVVRLVREGFRTVTDTVVVRGDGALTRRYTLERQ